MCHDATYSTTRGWSRTLWSGSSMASDSQMNRIPGPVHSPPHALRWTRKLVLVLRFHRCAIVVPRCLLRWLQPWEMLARHVDPHPASHFDTWIGPGYRLITSTCILFCTSAAAAGASFAFVGIVGSEWIALSTMLSCGVMRDPRSAHLNVNAGHGPAFKC